jgi:hypothetical protein
MPLEMQGILCMAERHKSTACLLPIIGSNLTTPFTRGMIQRAS